MKRIFKVIAIFTVLVIAGGMFGGCFLKDLFNGNNDEVPTYAIEEIEYLPNHHFNEAWKYLNTQEQYAINKGNSVRLMFGVVLKDEKGNDIDGEIDLFISPDFEANAAYVYFDGSASLSNTKVMLDIDVPEIPNTELIRQMPIEIEFSERNNSALKLSAPITVTVYIDVVKAIQNYEINISSSTIKKEYLQGEGLDISGITVDLDYKDGAEESIPLADLMNMPQFNGTRVNNFDSEAIGNYKNMSIQIEIQDYGSRTTSLSYKVLPNNDWEPKTAIGLKYYLHSSMTESAEAINGLDFIFVELEDGVVLKMVYDSNYYYTAIQPNASAYQNIINEVPTGSPSFFSAFNALIPEGQAATVTSATSTRGATAVEYTLTNGTKNTMYSKITAFTGNLNKQRAMTITVENSDALTETQKTMILDFVAMVSIIG